MMDNYDIWLADDLEKERWRESKPVCAFCEEHIQDEHKYVIPKLTGEVVLCESCAEQYAEELAEDFKQDCLDRWKTDNY